VAARVLVEEAEEAAVEAPIHSQAPLPTPAKGRFEGLPKRWTLIGVGAVLLVLLSGIGISRFSRKAAELPLPRVEVAPLVVLPGRQGNPVFSPDGNQVAFEEHDWKRAEQIYTTLVDGAKPLRLAQGFTPSWSPDGRQVAFFALLFRHQVHFCPRGISSWWSRAPLIRLARQLLCGLELVARWNDSGLVRRQRSLQLDYVAFARRFLHTAALVTITSGVRLWSGFFPDGSTVAFVRKKFSSEVVDLFLMPATGGEPKRLTFDNRFILGITWTPDSREIVFSSLIGGFYSLWRIFASGGTPRPLEGVGIHATNPSISPKGSQLAYEQELDEQSIWGVDLRDDKSRRGPPRFVISAKGHLRGRNFLPMARGLRSTLIALDIRKFGLAIATGRIVNL
jgi:dipeptidyl aminopeptidase/acylaminoacyl peptidase